VRTPHFFDAPWLLEGIADGAIAGYLDGAHYLKITCTSGQPPAPAPIVTARRKPGSRRAIE
jgi:hypothetical protein